MPFFENSLIKLIKQLACFTSNNSKQPIQVKRIEQGQSSFCFNVLFNNQHFFVKFLNNNVGVNSEIIATQAVSALFIAPPIVFHDQKWLVTEFVHGTSLHDRKFTLVEKIEQSVTLMKRCHSIPTQQLKLPEFNVHQAVYTLAISDTFTLLQKKAVLNVLKGLVQRYSEVGVVNEIDNQFQPTDNKKVFCHGDLNFSNVLMSDRAWLIDFECACLSEAEFDLAMFIAINAFTIPQQNNAIYNYVNDNKTSINTIKLNIYLQYAYLLNGLWYLDKARNQQNLDIKADKKLLFTQLGLQQLSLFDDISFTNSSIYGLMR